MSPRWMVVLAIAGVAIAQEGPRIEFSKKLHDFGRLVAGEKRACTFEFRNAGTRELVVRKVLASCACTATLLSDQRLSPGETGEIEIFIDSTGRMGRFQASIRVVTNDPSQHDGAPNHTSLTVTAQIENLVRVTPQGAFFASARRGQPHERRLILTPLLGDTLEILGIEDPLPWLTAEWKRLEGEGRGRFELLVRLGENAPMGELGRNLVLLTNLARQPRLEIPILGSVEGDVRCTPSPLNLQEVKRGEIVCQAIHLQRDQGGPLELLGVEASPKVLVPEAIELVAGRFWEIGFAVPEDAPAGPFSCILTIEIDDPIEPIRRVPVSGWIEPLLRLEPAGLLIPREPSRGLADALLYAPDGYGSGIEVRAPDWLAVEVEECVEGYRLRFRLLGDPRPADVWILTGVPGEERLRLPLVFQREPGPEIHPID